MVFNKISVKSGNTGNSNQYYFNLSWIVFNNILVGTLTGNWINFWILSVFIVRAPL